MSSLKSLKSGKVAFDLFKYSAFKNGTSIMRQVTDNCFHFVVPSKIVRNDSSEYRVVGIGRHERPHNEVSSIITFDESSEITTIPVWFIGCYRSTFTLPPLTKRVLGSSIRVTPFFPMIYLEMSDQRFVSVAESRVIMNHFPLELVYQHSFWQKYFIRESVRFVSSCSFNWNMSIRTVIFLSSVESIGDYAFWNCHNLWFIRFKRNSRLKIIGECSFFPTSLESIDIPSKVEEIGRKAFCSCKKLRSVRYVNEMKILKIGEDVLWLSKIESLSDLKFQEKINILLFYLK